MNSSKKTIAVYPGTFDPITNGHLNIIERALPLFEKIIVAVAINPSKKTFFSYDERIKLIKESTKDILSLDVVGFDGLIVNFVKKINAHVIIRGLRLISDFEYEFQMALSNYKISNVETIFFMTTPEYSYISSTLIKEIALFGGDIRHFVPEVVISAIKNKINESSCK